MKEYTFEVYYKYDGPSIIDPFSKEKNSEQIQDALNNFVQEVPQYINSLENAASSLPVDGNIERRIVSIKTTANKEEVEKAVIRKLRELDLKAEPL